ncbi:hypothetical protein [Nannocystis bainbridge]|uniref:Protein kinase domain-containing protein n=1 Tax=Nannocystis bainbridge TaxID=2995303 RepID=A0ABT5DST3_9BACT|nr:hypothetical protein [Nannocystis bainbridge]MDC0715788.1 hypothetical protein [Nannocystis bainbridge]
MRTSLAAPLPGPDRDAPPPGERGSPQPGDRLAGRYKLLTRVRGEGAAHVYLAHDGHAEVGLLAVDPARCDPRDWVVFTDVVAFASAARIPGLALFHGLSAAPAPPFCLAHASGRTLAHLLREEGPIAWQRALALGERLATILAAVESTLGIAHRALTPDRCVLTSDHDLHILDYGVAEIEPFASPDDATHRAPEQRRGPGDHRSDVYSLAAILFELIAGERPSGRLTPRLRSSVRDAPQHVDDLFARALAPDPERRYPDLESLRVALHAALAQAPVARVVTPASPILARPTEPATLRPAPAIVPAAAAMLDLRTGPAPLAAPAPAASVRILAPGVTPAPMVDPGPAPTAAPAAIRATDRGVQAPAVIPAPDRRMQAPAVIPAPARRVQAPAVIPAPRPTAAPAAIRQPDRAPAIAADPRFAAPAAIRSPAAASAPLFAARPAAAVTPAAATLRDPSPAVARLNPPRATVSAALTEIIPPATPVRVQESPVRRDILSSLAPAFISPPSPELPARDGTTLIDPPSLRPVVRAAPKPDATELLPDLPARLASASSQLRADARLAQPAASISSQQLRADARDPAAAISSQQLRAAARVPAAAIRSQQLRADARVPAAAISSQQLRAAASRPNPPAPLEPEPLAPSPAPVRPTQLAARPASPPPQPRVASSAATSDPHPKSGPPDRRLLIAAVFVINLSLALIVLYLFMR